MRSIRELASLFPDNFFPTVAATLLAVAIPGHGDEPVTQAGVDASSISAANLELLAGTKTPLRNGDKISIFGDSITMQEHIDKEESTIMVIFLGVNDVTHGAKGTTPEDKGKGILTCDGIHLSPQGNALVANVVAGGIADACAGRKK